MARVIELGQGTKPVLTPELRAWIDRVIVPALMQEWLEQEENSSFLRIKTARYSCESSGPSDEVKP